MRSWIGTVLMIGALASGCATTGRITTPRRVVPGQIVRVTSSSFRDQGLRFVMVGQVASMEEDALTLRLGRHDHLVSVPVAAVERLEMRTGPEQWDEVAIRKRSRDPRAVSSGSTERRPSKLTAEEAVVLADGLGSLLDLLDRLTR